MRSLSLNARSNSAPGVSRFHQESSGSQLSSVQSISTVREITVRCSVSGKALAAGIAAILPPVASAIPLTHFSNGA
jgi:hypothetical protein